MRKDIFLKRKVGKSLKQILFVFVFLTYSRLCKFWCSKISLQTFGINQSFFKTTQPNNVLKQYFQAFMTYALESQTFNLPHAVNTTISNLYLHNIKVSCERQGEIRKETKGSAEETTRVTKLETLHPEILKRQTTTSEDFTCSPL